MGEKEKTGKELKPLLRTRKLIITTHDRKPLGVRGWSALYTTSYQMVHLSITSGELLYDRISKFIRDYVNSVGVQNTVTEANLAEFVAVWQSYKIMTKWIWHLFMHLESSVIKLNELLTLTSVALVQFHQCVYEPFHTNLTTLALSTIEREREGEIVDRLLLQETLQVRTGTSHFLLANYISLNPLLPPFCFYFCTYVPF